MKKMGWRPRSPTRADRVESVMAGVLAGAAVGIATWYLARMLTAREPLSLTPPGDDPPNPRRPVKGVGTG